MKRSETWDLYVYKRTNNFQKSTLKLSKIAELFVISSWIIHKVLTTAACSLHNDTTPARPTAGESIDDISATLHALSLHVHTSSNPTPQV